MVLTHTFGTPRERAYKAYTNPQEIPKWWGPRRSEVKVEELDPRPDERYRLVVNNADGQDSGFHGIFHEMVTNELLMRTFEFEGVPGHVMLGTVTFEELNGNTKLTTKSVFPSVTDRDQMGAAGTHRGARDAMEQLAELVASL
jgi:uncharacterized protein YndB with AHSA1/START domain